MKKIISALIASVILISGIFLATLVPTQSFGATAFTPISGKTYYLAGAGVTSSANTINLSSFTLPDPNNTPIVNSMFSGTQYGVLEAQTSKTEDITFTGVTQNSNGTATLTGVTRGISFYSPFVASTTLQLAHAGGATFILSNPAAFYAQFLTNTNSNNIYGTFTFSSTSPPVYDADPVWANFSTQALADVSYVNSVVAAGCANGSTTVKGCVQLATAAQTAAGTATGSTAAALVPANSTFSVTSGNAVVPVGNTFGYLNQGWLGLSQAFTWTGLHTFNTGGIIDNASSTFTSTVNLNGTTLLNGASLAHQFGGTGANGALNISSGTTTVNLNSASYYELDYTSISITGTGALTFSNPNSKGTFIAIRSQGNVTLTCGGDCIYATGMGAAGGAVGSGVSVGTVGNSGNPFYLFSTNGGSGGGGSSGTGGAVPTAIAPGNWISSTSTLMKYGGQFWVGAGGGSGGCSGTTCGTRTASGGTGGGGILLEVGGSLNLTSTNAIVANGTQAPASTCQTGTYTEFGGGGGGGGFIFVIYNLLTANTGTLQASGGAAGLNAASQCGTGSGDFGGGGGASGYTAGGNGASTNTNGAVTGGTGATGATSTLQNTNFF
jgi:hypothetical protein